MRKTLLLCSLGFILFVGVAHTTKAQDDPEYASPPYNQPPQAWIKYYENEIKKCQDFVDELSLAANKAQILFDNEKLNSPLRRIYTREKYEAEKRIRSWCQITEDQKKVLREYVAKLPPDPEPTPTPVTTLVADGKQTDGLRGGLTDKQLKDFNAREMKFFKGYEQKRREAKEAMNKFVNDTAEYVKKLKPRQPAPGSKAETTSSGGLSKTTFTTPQGRIIAYLPDDMRAGDTISGSVFAEPNGNTAEECAKNFETLNGYQLMIANQPVRRYASLEGLLTPSVELRLIPCKLESHMITLTGAGFGPPVTSGAEKTQPTSNDEKGKALGEPANGNKTPDSSSGIKVGLKDPVNGVEVASATIPVVTGVDPRTQPPAPDVFRLPNIGQQGRPIEITGPFDGNTSNTTLNLKPVQDFEKGTENVSGGFGLIRPLAELPRKCVFESPSNFTGPVEIILKEGNVETKGTYRNIGVQLRAPKTNLMKGEKTTVTIEVNGLEGITEDVPLQLDAKGVVQMEGGNNQNLRIRPQDVQGGRYTTTRGITGQQAGGFSVTATVIDSTGRPIKEGR